MQNPAKYSQKMKGLTAVLTFALLATAQAGLEEREQLHRAILEYMDKAQCELGENACEWEATRAAKAAAQRAAFYNATPDAATHKDIRRVALAMIDVAQAWENFMLAKQVGNLTSSVADRAVWFNSHSSAIL
jgi:DNA-binding TFAR19-related protein (PDSD5 family)